MIDPRCAVKVGTHTGPYWRDAEIPESTWQVCDRHRSQYDERDDLGPQQWVPAPHLLTDLPASPVPEPGEGDAAT